MKASGSNNVIILLSHPNKSFVDKIQQSIDYGFNDQIKLDNRKQYFQHVKTVETEVTVTDEKLADLISMYGKSNIEIIK